MTFLEFDIEPESMCCYDKLSIYESDVQDTTTLAGEICGSGFVKPAFLEGILLYYVYGRL